MDGSAEAVVSRDFGLENPRIAVLSIPQILFS